MPLAMRGAPSASPRLGRRSPSATHLPEGTQGARGQACRGQLGSLTPKSTLRSPQDGLGGHLLGIGLPVRVSLVQNWKHTIV